MTQPGSTDHQTQRLALVLGGTGKTGSRIVQRLRDQGAAVRVGSRSATPAFDWHDESGWDACLAGVSSVYISYTPDLAIPGATATIRALVDAAKRAGVGQAVLLSGRGETEAQACEAVVIESGLAWTVVRASWFDQNFSEGAFADMVRAGRITLPAAEVAEPFVDVDDIAEVAAAALIDSRQHNGEVYEVTGPRLMTFADVAAELTRATGRTIAYTAIPHQDFVAGLADAGTPEEVVWLMDYLFATVLDGRNARVGDGVARALGRPARDFADYAQAVAASGAWRGAA